jgi:hypothetical protein
MSIKDLRSRLSIIVRWISGLSKGGLSRLNDQVGTGIARRQVADRLGRLALDVLEQRDRDLEREGHVELAAIKARTAVERFGVYSIPSR